MCWVWWRPEENAHWGASLDYAKTFPMGGGEAWGNQPVHRSQGQPIYRSGSGLKRFRQFHCPPFGIDVVIDKTWQDIILKFVPANRVQFFPVRLIARGETTEEFSWLLTFDRVNCIDIKSSNITDKIEHNGEITIMQMKKFYHVPGCLNGLHLARDERMNGHLLVSDALKQALAATGESSMFLKPEQMENYYSNDFVPGISS